MGASRVEFNQPVWFYVDNFLHFESGIDVPSGFFNRDKGQWEAGPSGRVIKIVSILPGSPDIAEVDVDGDGSADSGATLTALGITDMERQQLVTKYAAGKSLWRVPIPHFSSWDCNWPFGPPPDSEGPNGGGPGGSSNDDPDDPKDPVNIDIQSQVLRGQVPISGTPFTLNYRSNRTAGWKVANQIQISLSGSTVPASLKRIELEVQVAGRTFTQDFPAQPNLSTTFEWDGLDAYARPLQGRQSASVRIGFVYDGSYIRSTRFGYNGNGVVITGDKTRQEIVLSSSYQAMVGPFDIRRVSIGGWTLSRHHVYDPSGRILYLGDGTKRSVQSINSIIETVVGNGNIGFKGDGGPALAAQINSPSGVAFGPDGALYIADAGNARIRRVDTKGIITTYAGTGTPGFSGDGGPAKSAQIQASHIRFAADGSLHLSVGDARLRRIDPLGIITTIAGDGTSGVTGDDGPALNARVSGATASVVSSDGTVYFAELNNQVIRAVKPDGTMIRVAGGSGGGDGPALSTQLSFPTDLALGPGEAVWVPQFSANTLRAITPNGNITTVAGGGNPPVGNGDGGLALAARLLISAGGGTEMTSDARGNVYLTERPTGSIRRIGVDGIITTLAGNGTPGFSGDGGPSTAAQLQPAGLVVAPDGSVYVAEIFAHRIRRISPPLPGFDGSDFALPSADGRELYRFNSAGRHLSTVNAFTGAVLLTFGYEADGQLVKITDANANATTIQRTADGRPISITGPYGARTLLTVDANGALATVADELGGTYTLVTSADGLLLSESDPLHHDSVFTFDPSGRLTHADIAGVNALDLDRTGVPGGHVVKLTSPSVVDLSYQIESPLSGGEVRTESDSADFVSTETRDSSGKRRLNFAGGGSLQLTLGPDARFDMQAPTEKGRVFTTAGNKVLTISRTQQAMLKLASDPLSLTSLSHTYTINGKTFIRAYDAATRTSTESSPLGRSRTVTADVQGRITKRRYADFQPTTFAYDARGRLTTSSTGTGATARLFKRTYSAAGYVATLADPLNRISRYTYDPVGRLIMETRPDGSIVKNARDPLGRVTSITPPGRPEHKLGFTPDGLFGTYTAPGNATTTFTYDGDRRLQQTDFPGGGSIAYTYDGANRLATRTQGGVTVTLAYDPITGNLASLTKTGGDAVAESYDGSIPMGETWTGTVPGSVAQTLDNNLRTASQTVNGANQADFMYDNDGLLTGAGALTLTRDPQRGYITQVTLGSVSEFRQHDDFGQVTAYSSVISGTPVYQAQYTYDRAGQLTQTVETVGAGSADTFVYRYDQAGRLTGWDKNGSPLASYTYDGNGNRLSSGATAATYDDQDRVLTLGATTYAFSSSGQLTTRTAGAILTSYTYDPIGNLTAVTLPGPVQVDYVIDARDRRIGKKVGGTLVRGYLYQDARRIVAELDGTGAVRNRFVWGDRQNVPAYLVNAAGTFRLVCDAAGSVRVVVNASTGAVAQRLDYDPFGRVLADTAPGFQPFGFGGGLYDTDTGLVRFGARDYEPETGRWTTKDPLLFQGGDCNLYAYVGNDPVNRTDPAGALAPGEVVHFTDDYGNDEYIHPQDPMYDMFKKLYEEGKNPFHYDPNKGGPPITVDFPDPPPPPVVQVPDYLPYTPLNGGPTDPITINEPQDGGNPFDGGPIDIPTPNPNQPITPIGGGSGLGGNLSAGSARDRDQRAGIGLRVFR